MRFATFLTKVGPNYTLQIPREVWDRLRLVPGDKIEVSLKKIKSSRLDLMLSENPLYRLLDVDQLLNDEDAPQG